MNSQLLNAMLPPGRRPAGPWSAQSQNSASTSAIVSVAAGAGVNAVVPQVIISKDIAPAAMVWLEYISIQVIDDSNYDQLYFAIRHNGARITPWEKFSGSQVVIEKMVTIAQVFESGLFELVGINISGTTESGAAPDGVALRVLARAQGYLLRGN